MRVHEVLESQEFWEEQDERRNLSRNSCLSLSFDASLAVPVPLLVVSRFSSSHSSCCSFLRDFPSSITCVLARRLLLPWCYSRIPESTTRRVFLKIIISWSHLKAVMNSSSSLSLSSLVSYVWEEEHHNKLRSNSRPTTKTSLSSLLIKLFINFVCDNNFVPSILIHLLVSSSLWHLLLRDHPIIYNFNSPR